MKGIQRTFKLKDNKIAEPEDYLGASLADGLRASGATFWSFLGETLNDLGYVPTKADPDVWIRLAVKPSGFCYYKMLLCYANDFLRI